MNKDNSLKKLTVLDKIKRSIRGFMEPKMLFVKKFWGYREGKRFIIDTKPSMKSYSDVELGNIANMEEKLGRILARNASEGEIVDGLSREEADMLLEWVIQRDRKILELGEQEEKIEDKSLLGFCGLSQGIIYTLLKNMGLHSRISNINPTITGRSLGGHAFNSVAIPIKEQDGQCHEKDYLLDATLRQFFLRNEVNVSEAFIKDKKFGNRVSMLAGYWCLNLPGGKEFAERILSKGFVELTPENAKIYGDSFILEDKMREKYSKKYEKETLIKIPKKREMITGISGEEHIRRMTDMSRQDSRGIDYEEEELEDWYGELMKTPLMKRKELQKQELDNQKVEKNRDVQLEYESGREEES